MKTSIRYILLGLVFYFVFLITQLPVSKVYYFAEDIIDEKKIPLDVYGLSGSLWQGEAKRIVYAGKPFNQVAWELHPLALLTGDLSASLRFKNAEADASGLVSYSFTGDLNIENLLVNIQATEALKMAKIPAFKLGGEFKLNLPRLMLADQRLTYVSGRLLWSDAKSIFPQKLDLGDLVVDLSTADDDVISARLSDGGGPLELGGGLTLTPDGKYVFNGEFASRDGRNSVLGRALGFMGRYDANGKAVLSRSGNVSEFGFLVN
ncbi:MAG: type II secretion system protein N [Gammaproteobacteria bacterium]|nr:type II secretion system protein N [Gammaproteobacteria bacterium]